MRLRNLKFERDNLPLEEGCPCVACRRSRGYLRHLFMADQMLGPILLSIHNITYYQRLMTQARESIVAGRYVEFVGRKRAGWQQVGLC
jgi:queuine tRNA-ribosyltransferase